MRVKVCGVARPRDARLAARLGAWAVGMVFVPDTPRFLAPARARRVRAAIPRGVLAVGVFRRPSLEGLRRAVRDLRLDAVQIEGGLEGGDPESASLPARVLSARVIPVVALASGRRRRSPRRGSLVLVEPARSDADRRAGRAPSESARAFARKTAAAWSRRGVRVVLAGGLAPETAAQAAAEARPWALDVSSGVESRPGVKGARLLRDFFDAVR